MALWDIRRKMHEAKRAGEIVEILIKHGVDDIFDRAKLSEKFAFVSHRKSEKEHQFSTPERVRMAFEELGPTFVKFGQLLSTRPDLLPAPYIRELEKLQDDVPPFTYQQVRRAVHDAFGKPIDQVFKDLGREPIASASVAQVHVAYLPSGEKVAVKVRRPKIEETIALDTNIILNLARFIKKRQLVDEVWQPVALAEEFRRSIAEELDFANEAHNIERFELNFAGSSTVRIPHIYKEYSNSGVVTMSYVHGVGIHTVMRDRSSRYPKKEIAKIGADAILKQVFDDAYFHGDMHPGNIFWLPDERRVAFLDFGLVGRLDKKELRAITLMLYGMLNKDAKKIALAAEELNIVASSAQSSDMEVEIAHFLEKYHGDALGDMTMSSLITDIFDIMLRYRIRMPANLVLFAKSLLSAEGIAVALDPEFDMFTFTRPYVERAVRKQLSVKEAIAEGANTAIQAARLARDIPDDLYWILKNLKENQFMVKLEHGGLHELLKEIAITGNRLAFSIIIAALVVGSSYVTHDHPTMGTAGYIIASLFGLGLIWSMIRGDQL